MMPNIFLRNTTKADQKNANKQMAFLILSRYLFDEENSSKQIILYVVIFF